jgi:dTDP-L-rhamnose 4-epimerase
MKKILITGGAGFIGSNLAKALLEKKYIITVIDNLSEQIHGKNPEIESPLYLSIKNQVRFIKSDVRDKSVLIKELPQHDVIIHLAAETGTGQSMYKIEHYTDVNIQATATILDILTNNKHQVSKFIIASSRSIYGEGKYFSKDLNTYVYPQCREEKEMLGGDFEVKYQNNKTPLHLEATDESSKIHPSSLYGITKQVQEQMIMTLCPSIGIQPVALRFQNVYGPGQSLKNPYTGILSIFSTQIKNNQDLNIFEDGEESRDFVYIKDVVDSIVKAIENDNANGEIFNVGSGVPTSVLTVAKTLIRLYDSSSKIKISGNFRLGDIRHNYADITKIKNELDFEPQYDFETGIKEFVNWVNKQEIQENQYEASINEMKEKGLFK